MTESARAISASPREVFDLLHERVRDDYDMDGQADLYAADGVLELPFARPGTPCRLQGREEILRFLKAAGQRALQAVRRIVRYDPLLVHDTADPEVIVAEFDLHGEVSATGRTYRIPFVQVLRVCHDQIVSMRDYFAGEARDIVDEALGAGQGPDPERCTVPVAPDTPSAPRGPDPEPPAVVPAVPVSD
jgi:ketosteroid isomerase-like protein